MGGVVLAAELESFGFQLDSGTIGPRGRQGWSPVRAMPFLYSHSAMRTARDISVWQLSLMLRYLLTRHLRTSACPCAMPCTRVHPCQGQPQRVQGNH